MIEIKLEGVEKAMKMFDPDKVRKAANAALNRVAGSAKTEASRLIRNEYNIKAYTVSRFLHLDIRAQGYNMVAIISGHGMGIPLYYYDAKQAGIRLIGEGAGKMRTKFLSRTGRKIGPVTVKVKRTGGRKIVSPHYGIKPFIAQMKGGGISVWVREGGERLPIEKMFGPGIGGLFGSRKIMQKVKQKINEVWSKELNHQLDYYLKRSQ